MDFELFSEDLFGTHLALILGEDKRPPRSKQFLKRGESKFSTEVLHAVLCRSLFFHGMILDKLLKDYDEFSKSAADLFIYFQNEGDNYIFYKNISVFDKLLMTCALACNIMWVDWSDKKSCIKYVPSCWSLYFEFKYKEKFFAEGGWDDFITHVESYQSYSLINSKNCISFKNDLATVEKIFEENSCIFSLSILKSDFIERVLKGKLCCIKHQPLFFVFDKLCFPKSSLNISETDLIEGYLQFFLLTSTVKERSEIQRKVLYSGQYESVRRQIESGEEIDVNMIKDALNEEYNSYFEEIRMLSTFEIRKRIFVDDAELNYTNQQCLFCGKSVRESLKAKESSNETLVKRIKLVIGATVKDFITVRADSMPSLRHLGGNKLKPIKKK